MSTGTIIDTHSTSSDRLVSGPSPTGAHTATYSMSTGTVIGTYIMSVFFGGEPFFHPPL